MLLNSICKEIELRQNYLEGEVIRTIYFGGGTPSLLTPEELGILLKKIKENFHCEPEEITIEVNPDDITDEYIHALKELSFNRISMGIQSFRQEDLIRLNRRHSPEQAIRAVKTSQAEGLTNISIDLIYGLPGQTYDQWKYNLNTALQLEVPHLSAYHLTYEKNTPLYLQKEEGKIIPVTEEVSESMFRLLIDLTRENGYSHYEISNFAKPGMESKHNSSYWKNIPYLGLGPSAHSYNLKSRQWNVPDISSYINFVHAATSFYEIEELDITDKYNEHIITSLRSCEGINTENIKTLFGDKYYLYFQKNAAKFLRIELLEWNTPNIRLTSKGLFISDSILSDLLMIED
jgi:oxygen-independent coproporphyrinogen-3 oxidase